MVEKREHANHIRAEEEQPKVTTPPNWFQGIKDEIEILVNNNSRLLERRYRPCEGWGVAQPLSYLRQIKICETLV